MLISSKFMLSCVSCGVTEGLNNCRLSDKSVNRSLMGKYKMWGGAPCVTNGMASQPRVFLLRSAHNQGSSGGISPTRPLIMCAANFQPSHHWPWGWVLTGHTRWRRLPGARFSKISQIFLSFSQLLPKFVLSQGVIGIPKKYWRKSIIIGQDRRSSAKKQNITSARSAILH